MHVVSGGSVASTRLPSLIELRHRRLDVRTLPALRVIDWLLFARSIVQQTCACAHLRKSDATSLRHDVTRNQSEHAREIEFTFQCSWFALIWGMAAVSKFHCFPTLLSFEQIVSEWVILGNDLVELRSNLRNNFSSFWIAHESQSVSNASSEERPKHVKHPSKQMRR